MATLEAVLSYARFLTSLPGVLLRFVSPGQQSRMDLYKVVKWFRGPIAKHLRMPGQPSQQAFPASCRTPFMSAMTKTSDSLQTGIFSLRLLGSRRISVAFDVETLLQRQKLKHLRSPTLISSMSIKAIRLRDQAAWGRIFARRQPQTLSKPSAPNTQTHSRFDIHSVTNDLIMIPLPEKSRNAPATSGSATNLVSGGEFISRPTLGNMQTHSAPGYPLWPKWHYRISVA